ncbi:MAG: amidohydrolase family protein [Candidatus Omnitrophica bacterium]|nr:amidohydrolase family protein [Candidatus Omnitrophota bacterium]
MIIDCHAHWLPEEIITRAHFYSKAWGDIEAHLAMMDSSGIDRAVLSYPTSDAHAKLGIAETARIYNDNVGKIIRRYPGRFIGAAVVPVDETGCALDELSRATRELGFRAVSLASSYAGRYLDDAIFLPLYKKAQEEGLPIFVHSQTIDPIGCERVQEPLLTPVVEYIFDTTMCIGKLMMGGFLRDYPGLNFVFSYFGGVAAHLKNRFDATYQMLRSVNFVKDLKALPSQHLKTLYVDTSGDTGTANFLAALDTFGAENILWGSDWPAKRECAPSIEAVRKLNITNREQEGILGENAAQILKGA